MSDFFGIGPALRAVAWIYFQSSRQTGRTRSLLDSVQQGDRVVFVTEPQRRRFERLLKERGITEINCIVIPPSNPEDIHGAGPPSARRTIFDHAWLEAYYLATLERAQQRVQDAERESSGPGLPRPEPIRTRWER